LAFCHLYIGEGTTTACEAGCLGVPWIAVRDKALGYLNDQEDKYELGKRIDRIDLALIEAEKYLGNINLKREWGKKREILLKDKIDVSSFLSWFILNYPESHRIMKSDPNYQNRFK
jgi:predicted glycosyltransferase